MQDSGCPPHIKVCVHGYTWNIYDDLECYVDGPDHYGYENGSTPWTFTDNKGKSWHYWLSDTEDDDDANNVADGTDGGSGIKDGPGSTLPAADNWGIGNTHWGTYGYGDYVFSFDPLPGKNDGWDYFAEYPNEHIAKEQLKKSYDDTIIEMKARSEALPPLVPDDATNGQPSVSANVFGPESPVEISFVAMENRQKTIYMSILAGTVAIKDTSGDVWDDGATATYDLASCTTAGQLPWKETVTKTWNGELGTGDLDDGEYTIKIKIEDQDGHVSDERNLTVKYDKTKPTGTISVSVTP